LFGLVQRLAHVGRVCITLLAVLGQRFRQHGIDLRCDCRIRDARRRQRIGFTVYQRRRAGQRIGRLHARHQVIERRAECIEIAA